jgi:hypothetical protein
LFAAERKRATWTRRCEEKLPKALSRLSYQVKDSEKFGLARVDGLEPSTMNPAAGRQVIFLRETEPRAARSEGAAAGEME